MLYFTIISEQYEKTVYIQPEICAERADRPFCCKMMEKRPESAGKAGFAVEFAPDSCYFNYRDPHRRTKNGACVIKYGKNDTKTNAALH